VERNDVSVTLCIHYCHTVCFVDVLLYENIASFSLFCADREMRIYCRDFVFSVSVVCNGILRLSLYMYIVAAEGLDHY